ncbi:putative extracellular aspartic endopeptidase [Aspergillus campestris IBT 28561]|uniref:Extracellular aspartic endopeptidase n=1 Tax=Aspergillus campestris (strain IBT 28561) TaxID=1392248 RepID=A0A2I1D438_ASPC2|nr:putative extracellular aspartic endopeptidase [Aspergillus campestris IBT 28561]PKY04630.1 putative extracellular aspartic endopeptidase [Aspergillus campestris IBT 28561]
MLVQTLLLIACLGYRAFSIPTPSPDTHQRRSFKVESIRRDNDIQGLVALRQAYRKYGINPIDLGVELPDFEPVALMNAVAKKNVSEPEAAGAVSAASVQEDAAFVSPVTVGGQKIMMSFDTGSADLHIRSWVMNPNVAGIDLAGREVFNVSNSTTFQKMNDATFRISYGDRSYAWGYVGTDTVNIGGAVVSGQAIGIPTTVSNFFLEDTHYNGLAGFAFSTVSTMRPRQQKNFLENLAKDLDEPVLTASLKPKAVGEYEFGFVDPDKYRGELVNITVDPSSGFWQIPSLHYKIGDGTLIKRDNATPAIADTGTTLMLLDDEVVKAYYAQVPNAALLVSVGGYTYPCSQTLPDLSVGFGDSHLAYLPGAFLGYSQVGTNRTTGEPVCFGGVQSNRGSKMQVLGDVFLKAFYVVFDLRGPSIAIATPR